jgi:subfamily B ATP-binding cassette protein MsbA
MKTFFRLLSFSKPYHHFVPEYLIYVSLFILFGLANIAMVMPLLDTLFGTPTQDPVVVKPEFAFSIDYFKELFNYYTYQAISENGKFGVLLYVCIILISFSLLKSIFAYLSQSVLTRMRVNLVRRLRSALFEKLSNLSLSFYQQERKGDLLSIISGDVVEIENTVVSSIQVIFREPLVIISTFVFLFFISPELTFFTLIFFPITGFLISSLSRRLKKKAGLSQQLQGMILNHTEETISGIRIIKAFNAEEFVGKNFEKENSKFSRSIKWIMNQREMASPLSEFLGVTVIAVIILYGGNLIFNNTSNLSPSAFITYIALYFTIIAPAKNTAGAVTFLQRGLAAGERVLRILDAPNTVQDAEDAADVAPFSQSIELKNVGFSYGEKTVLNNICLRIVKGKMIALVGESGAGKSTLADLIPRFYDVSSGAIEVDGVDIRKVRMKSLRNQIAIVSQEAILFNDSVLNNIAFGDPQPHLESVIAAAKAANAHEFITQLEQGYDAVIGDRGMKLSGGQRQRLTIARAIYKNAPILILDEATSALDTESERLVQQAINELMKNRTSIVIAHRLSTIRHADEIIVMHQGEIVERGTHQELLEKQGYYNKLVALQEVR